MNYDDNLIFVMFYIKVSCITQFLTNLNSVISFFSLSQFFKQSTNYKKFDFQYWWTQTFEVTQFPLCKPKTQTDGQYPGSADCGEIDLKSDINQTDSG